ncbi:MAG: glycosyl transferase [Candidatus Lokiarchaeota archaeon]|nr:glycosyl transferase [Candidatus Lokiarchaeota archaeon]
MQFGYFDDDKKEYVITRPDTPLPWINYLGCQNYYGIISNTGGGYSFYKDARFRRITRYRYNNVPKDFGGRYIYVRDNNNSEFWSPMWQPTRKTLDQYKCRHGLNYSIISSQYKNIEIKIKYFVPLGDDLEIWQVKIKNLRTKKFECSLFSCVEFCLWDAYDDAINFQRNFNTCEMEVSNNTIYHKTEYRERRNHFAFFSCSAPISGFDTNRDSFLGHYRSWQAPIVVENGKSCNSIAHGWSPIGSHHIELSLDPNETKVVIFLLGYHENKPTEKFESPNSQVINKKSVQKVISKYLDPIKIKTAFKELKSYWATLLETFTLDCPSIHTNRMVNIWNPYQCMITYNLSRSASFFESGVSRGFGFRDSNQDILGFVHLDPQRTRARIIDLASTQLENGGAYHQYQPLTKRGNHDIGSNFNDDPLWLILSVAAYIKETGDLTILNEQVPFENKQGSETSLFEHLKKSVKYIDERVGPHGLPLIGRADWNDCLNLNSYSTDPNESFQTGKTLYGNKAESVFIAALYMIAARELSQICSYMGLHEQVKNYCDKADKMNGVIMDHGWDGEWFLRAYDNEGKKIGSQKCEEGRIYIEPQGFCIMAGVGVENGRAIKALEAVKKKLASKHGIMLLDPPYSRYYLNLGEISSYPPGYKENGSIFCHTNPWIMIAESILGNGGRAFDYYLRINPSYRENISEIHRCEPYIYAQTIAGESAATFGEAKNSWLTGTAAWNYVAIVNWILGIRPTNNGLKIYPVIPNEWKGFKATRIFRGVKYNIIVERITRGNQTEICVNDCPIEGNIIPLPEKGVQEVQVIVKLSENYSNQDSVNSKNDLKQFSF